MKKSVSSKRCRPHGGGATTPLRQISASFDVQHLMCDKRSMATISRLNLGRTQLQRSPSGLTLVVNIRCEGLDSKTNKLIKKIISFSINRPDFVH
jgi:hypothetical protein